MFYSWKEKQLIEHESNNSALEIEGPVLFPLRRSTFFLQLYKQLGRLLRSEKVFPKSSATLLGNLPESLSEPSVLWSSIFCTNLKIFLFRSISKQKLPGIINLEE